MEWKGLIWIGLGYVLVNAINSVRRVECGVTGMKLLGIRDGQTIMQVTIWVKNPTMVSVAIQRITGTIYMDGRNVGYINTSFLDGSIKSKSITQVPIDVVLTTSDLAAATLSQVARGSLEDVVVGFDGEVKVQGITIPVKSNV